MDLFYEIFKGNEVVILIDSREKDLHVKHKLEKLGIKTRMQKLDFCDYSFEIDGKSYEKEFALERKKTFDELIQNLTKGKEQFYREFERAADCKVVLFVEQSKNFLYAHTYRSRIHPKYVRKMLHTLCDKYMIRFEYVRRSDSAEFILTEIKNYLESR